MRRWEYLIVSSNHERGYFVDWKRVNDVPDLPKLGWDMPHLLKHYGEQGWEVVGVTGNEQGHVSEVVMKRELP